MRSDRSGKPVNLEGVLRQVWIVNHHAMVPEKDGESGRHFNMAKYLPREGWAASLIVASTSHPSGAQRARWFEMRRMSKGEGVPTLWVRTSAYKGMGTRLVGMMVFALALLLPGMTRGLARPDVVIGSTVHPLAAWAGYRLSKRHKVPFVYEVRDVWPETLIDMGKLADGSLMARGMKALSMYLVRKARLVLSPLPSVDALLREEGYADKPFLWVSNGFDGVREDPRPEPVPQSRFTFMYLGSHGNANALDQLLGAFDLACERRPDLDLWMRFVGDGPLKSDLEVAASRLQSGKRTVFEDRIPSAEVVERSREADALVVALHDWPVYRYGISLNKLFSYMYACRPIVIAASTAYNPVLEARAGLAVPSADRSALADALIRMAEASPEERSHWAANGYEHVLQHYSHEVLAAKLARGLASTI